MLIIRRVPTCSALRPCTRSPIVVDPNWIVASSLPSSTVRRVLLAADLEAPPLRCLPWSRLDCKVGLPCPIAAFDCDTRSPCEITTGETLISPPATTVPVFSLTTTRYGCAACTLIDSTEATKPARFAPSADVAMITLSALSTRSPTLAKTLIDRCSDLLCRGKVWLSEDKSHFATIVGDFASTACSTLAPCAIRPVVGKLRWTAFCCESN